MLTLIRNDGDTRGKTTIQSFSFIVISVVLPGKKTIWIRRPIFFVNPAKDKPAPFKPMTRSRYDNR
ncbi:MAG: hypothetical protein GY703_23600 [Gammaproteobacteria bacterium]|nr:hypothetical protein [Gammaproteobacteria bacterium]